MLANEEESIHAYERGHADGAGRTDAEADFSFDFRMSARIGGEGRGHGRGFGTGFANGYGNRSHIPYYAAPYGFPPPVSAAPAE